MYARPNNCTPKDRSNARVPRPLEDILCHPCEARREQEEFRFRRLGLPRFGGVAAQKTAARERHRSKGRIDDRSDHHGRGSQWNRNGSSFGTIIPTIAEYGLSNDTLLQELFRQRNRCPGRRASSSGLCPDEWLTLFPKSRQHPAFPDHDEQRATRSV
jgi:hypothetical protein